MRSKMRSTQVLPAPFKGVYTSFKLLASSMRLSWYTASRKASTVSPPMYSMRPCLTPSSKSMRFTPEKMSRDLISWVMPSAMSEVIWQPSLP